MSSSSSLLCSIFGSTGGNNNNNNNNKEEEKEGTTNSIQKHKKHKHQRDDIRDNSATSSAVSIFDQTVDLPAPRACPTRQELKKQQQKKTSNNKRQREESSAAEQANKKKRKPKHSIKSDKEEETASASSLKDDDAPKETKQGGNEDEEDDDDKHGNADTKEDRTIFVGNLPVGTTRKTLAQIFSKCGLVSSTRLRSVGPVAASCTIKLPPHEAGNQALHRRVCANTPGQIDTSVKSSVQGYVVFESQESVAKALQLNNTVVDMAGNAGAGGTTTTSRRIRVDHAQTTLDARRSVFVGNLPYAADESTLQDHFVQTCQLASIKDVEGVRIVRDPDTFQCKGFAYVLLAERSMVATALQRVPGTLYMHRPLRVAVCGKRFKNNHKNNHNNNKGAGDSSIRSTGTKRKREEHPSSAAATAVGALRRVLAKQHQQQQWGGSGAGAASTKKRRARSTKKNNDHFHGSKPPAGVSRRAAAQTKVEKRVKKLQKRIHKGMGKARRS